MKLEITPEPSPEERAAIAAALAAPPAGANERCDPWWEAGVREALEDAPDED